MAMDTCRIPPEWKQPVMNFRDAVTVEQGQEVVEAIAALAATENGQELLAQLPALAEATRANPQSTLEAIAAIAEGEAVAPAAGAVSPAPTLGGRPVPSCIAGMVAELVELAYHNPQAARKVLQEAIASKVEPGAAVPADGVRFKLQNEYLAADTFPWDNGRSLKIPVDRTMGPWPEAQVKRLEAAIATRPKTLPGGIVNRQGATVLVRV